jgi:hypothetical protein
MSPSGKEELLQIPIMSCGNCGAVNADMLGDLNPDELK